VVGAEARLAGPLSFEHLNSVQKTKETKMLVKILSDLHLHPMQTDFRYIDHGERVCILAGDICEGMRGVNWALANIPYHIDVIYVPGNHEYYGHDYLELQKNFEQHNLSNTHVTVLDNALLEIWGIKFAGSTLWTDFQAYKDPASTLHWAFGLNDSRWIKYGNRPINAYDMINLNTKAMDFLEHVHADVLVTHYAPLMSESDRWKGHVLTPGFITEIPERVHKKFKYHIHGHTHNPFDYEMPYGTRVICNPRGYGYEVPSFNEELVINI